MVEHSRKIVWSWNMNKVLGTLCFALNENYLNRGFPTNIWKYLIITTIIMNFKDN
jgi:hypothetical protein